MAPLETDQYLMSPHCQLPIIKLKIQKVYDHLLLRENRQPLMLVLKNPLAGMYPSKHLLCFKHHGINIVFNGENRHAKSKYIHT